MREPAEPGWALAGDASIHQALWSGVGIDMASTHATFLAEALLTLPGGQQQEAGALADYWRRCNDHALATYQETTEFGKDLRALINE